MDVLDQLVRDNVKTGIWRYKAKNPLAISYVLPVNTIPEGRSLDLLFNDQAKVMRAGSVPAALFQTGAVSRAIFNSIAQPSAATRDCAFVAYSSADLMREKSGAVEQQLWNFVQQARKNIAISLVNPVRLVKEEDFLKAAAEFEEKHSGDHAMITVKSVIRVFNDLVAKRHGGEVKMDGYGLMDGKLTVGVRLYDACKGCPTSNLSIEKGLNEMLLTFASKHVQAVKVLH